MLDSECQGLFTPASRQGIPSLSKAFAGWGKSSVHGLTLGVQAIMKVRSSVKRICEHCKVVRRKQRNYVICAANPRHKQRQG